MTSFRRMPVATARLNRAKEGEDAVSFHFFASGGNEGEKQKINSLDSGMRRNDGNLEGVWAARELLFLRKLDTPTRALSIHGDSCPGRGRRHASRLSLDTARERAYSG